MYRYWNWRHKHFFELGTDKSNITFWYKGHSHGIASFFWIKLFGKELFWVCFAHPIKHNCIGWWFKGLSRYIQIRIFGKNTIKVRTINI